MLDSHSLGLIAFVLSHTHSQRASQQTRPAEGLKGSRSVAGLPFLLTPAILPGCVVSSVLGAWLMRALHVLHVVARLARLKVCPGAKQPAPAPLRGKRLPSGPRQCIILRLFLHIYAAWPGSAGLGVYAIFECHHRGHVSGPAVFGWSHSPSGWVWGNASKAICMPFSGGDLGVWGSGGAIEADPVSSVARTRWRYDEREWQCLSLASSVQLISECNLARATTKLVLRSP